MALRLKLAAAAQVGFADPQPGEDVLSGNEPMIRDDAAVLDREDVERPEEFLAAQQQRHRGAGPPPVAGARRARGQVVEVQPIDQRQRVHAIGIVGSAVRHQRLQAGAENPPQIRRQRLESRMHPFIMDCIRGPRSRGSRARTPVGIQRQQASCIGSLPLIPRPSSPRAPSRGPRTIDNCATAPVQWLEMELRRLNIGCFGGGTGLPSLLGGLKANPWLHLNAVVTMFDSGGSSGQLRDELGVLPPGDVLRCALAMARNEREARRVLLARLADPERARRAHRRQPAALDDGAIQRRFSGRGAKACDRCSA